MIDFSLVCLGLLLTIAGVSCAGLAFVRTWREHEHRPIFPVPARAAARTRQMFRHLAWWRKPQQVVGRVSASLGGLTASVRGVVTGPAVPPDAPMEEAVRLLVQRIARIEQNAADDRKQHNELARSLREESAKATSALHRADEELLALNKALATSTVKLQLWGLILIGSGAILLTVPTLSMIIAGL